MMDRPGMVLVQTAKVHWWGEGAISVLDSFQLKTLKDIDVLQRPLLCEQLSKMSCPCCLCSEAGTGRGELTFLRWNCFEK